MGKITVQGLVKGHRGETLGLDDIAKLRFLVTAFRVNHSV